MSENEERTTPSGKNASTDFSIKSTDTEFNEKKDNVFGSLELLERKHEAYEKVRSKKEDNLKSDPVDDRLIDDKPRGPTGRSHGIRGRGRSAAGPAFRGRFSRRNAPYIPSYRREPRKWTMYDLSDVDSNTMSEKSTKAAALSFLSDLKKRKSSETKTDTDNSVKDLGEKVVFKKPKPQQEKELLLSSKSSIPSTSCGKLVMPEYNFGTKSKKEKQQTKQKQTVESDSKTEEKMRKSNVNLSHLMTYDEEDEEEVELS